MDLKHLKKKAKSLVGNGEIKANLIDRTDCSKVSGIGSAGRLQKRGGTSGKKHIWKSSLNPVLCSGRWVTAPPLPYCRLLYSLKRGKSVTSGLGTWAWMFLSKTGIEWLFLEGWIESSPALCFQRFPECWQPDLSVWAGDWESLIWGILSAKRKDPQVVTSGIPLRSLYREVQKQEAPPYAQTFQTVFWTFTQSA